MRIFYSTFLHLYTMQCKGEKVCINIWKINIIYMYILCNLYLKYQWKEKIDDYCNLNIIYIYVLWIQKFIYHLKWLVYRYMYWYYGRMPHIPEIKLSYLIYIYIVSIRHNLIEVIMSITLDCETVALYNNIYVKTVKNTNILLWKIYQ